MRTALVVFTKVPKTGETKTRLTTEREGILTAEEARMLYEGCVLDVINCCIASGSGDVMVCYNQGGDRKVLEKLLEGLDEPQKIKEIFLRQRRLFRRLYAICRRLCAETGRTGSAG